MNRRASLPGANELFRPTKNPAPIPEPAVEPEPDNAAASPAGRGAAGSGPASGRVRHDHKITVYFSEEELLALEDANLELRRTHGIRVDRGRIVRVAVAQALADLQANGAAAFLVSELDEQ
ncbi:hypothetical protein [Tessaracoccus lacteus]|uniref:Cobyrinic acid a,c-diamide synthase n=1 Tax=Tessaracoccus lacteus TaxID=3041766 RepID=A0ABY8PUW5_9ACTN|nr:hypothetical protein [Tessaracoccus sp. T21]WGT46239.1 hypothetical protein QH948_08690 [Tessaracoccus sp. T21]